MPNNMYDIFYFIGLSKFYCEFRTIAGKVGCRFIIVENYDVNKDKPFVATVTLVMDSKTKDIDVYVTSTHLPQYMVPSVDLRTFKEIIEELCEFCHGGKDGKRSEALQEAIEDPFIVEYEFEKELNEAFQNATPFSKSDV
jgi:hypothetical protein